MAFSSSESINTARDALTKLLATQNLAVLATAAEGRPYTSLVAVAASMDMKYLYFATNRNTRKYEHLHHNPHVALMMDNRENQPRDFSEAMAATALGTAETMSGEDLSAAVALMLRKHPKLSEFLADPQTALVRVMVASYVVVSRFQEVVEMEMGSSS